MTSPVKLLMLDLDGTVRRPKSGAAFINDPKDQEIIPEAAAAIAFYVEQGWTLVGITNQGGVLYEHKTIGDCIEEQQYTLALCPALQTIYYCPDEGQTLMSVGEDPAPRKTRQEKARFRKPDPGMLDHALFKWDATISLYVGDREEDRQAAANAGVKFLTHTEWWAHGC